MDAATDTRVIGGDVITIDPAGHVRLTVARSRHDGTLWFPPQAAVADGGELETTTVGPIGTVYASTLVRVGPAAFEPPYVLSYVDLDGVRVLVHSPGERPLLPGTRVELVMGRIGTEAGDGTSGGTPGRTHLRSYVAQPLAGGTA